MSRYSKCIPAAVIAILLMAAVGWSAPKRPKTLEIGQSLGLEINIPYDVQPVIIEGNIVWSKENDAGINFGNVVQGDLNRVIQYIKGEKSIVSQSEASA